MESIAFDPESLSLVSGSRDGKARRHTLEGQSLRIYQGMRGSNPADVWGGPPHILSLSWSPTLKAIVAGTSEGSLWVLESESARAQAIATDGSGPIYGIVGTDAGLLLGRDGRIEPVASSDAPSDSSIDSLAADRSDPM